MSQDVSTFSCRLQVPRALNEENLEPMSTMLYRRWLIRHRFAKIHQLRTSHCQASAKDYLLWTSPIDDLPHMVIFFVHQFSYVIFIFFTSITSIIVYCHIFVLNICYIYHIYYHLLSSMYYNLLHIFPFLGIQWWFTSTGGPIHKDVPVGSHQALGLPVRLPRSCVPCGVRRSPMGCETSPVEVS